MGISPLPRQVKYGNYVGEVIDEVSYQRNFEQISRKPQMPKKTVENLELFTKR